jgi:hypothetical protein
MNIAIQKIFRGVPEIIGGFIFGNGIIEAMADSRWPAFLPGCIIDFDHRPSLLVSQQKRY